MKKTVIHRITIGEAFQKEQLQILLPKDTVSIHGIRVTTSGMPVIPSTKQEVGWLWLQLAGFGETFFAEVARVPKQDYDRVFFQSINQPSFGNGKAWIDGGSESEFTVLVNEPKPLLEGYYRDLLGTHFSSPYWLTIYITIER